MDNSTWYIIGFVVIIALLVIATNLISKKQSTGVTSLPYQKQDYLLTRAERSFYEVLRRAAPDLCVFPQVRMAAVVKVRKGTENWQAHQNRISAKQLDFVLCTTDTLSPVLVIELDDSSHRQPNRQSRDAFIDAVLASSAIPILHVPAANTYNQQELAQTIQAQTRA